MASCRPPLGLLDSPTFYFHPTVGLGIRCCLMKHVRVKPLLLQDPSIRRLWRLACLYWPSLTPPQGLRNAGARWVYCWILHGRTSDKLRHGGRLGLHIMKIFPISICLLMSVPFRLCTLRSASPPLALHLYKALVHSN